MTTSSTIDELVGRPLTKPETREERANREALDKLIHDRRWERDGFGQIKYGEGKK